MATFWTIENAGVEKTLAAWGIDDVTTVFVNQGEDVATLSKAGRPYDAAYLFAYKSTCIIRRDRTGTASGTAFTGGSVYFTGLVVHPHVGASGRREFQACRLVGPWWYLKERGFEQQYREVESVTDGVPTYVTPNPTKSRIFLNLELGTYGQITITKLDTGEQLTEILNWTLKPFVDAGSAAPFQIGTIGIAVDAPVDEVKNITCAEAAEKMFRWSPDVVAWFDYSTTPPTFHALRRAALTAFNLDLTTTRPTQLNIVPRFDLQRPFVKIQYEITDSDNGVTLQRTEEEIYPDPPPTGALNQFAGVPFVVDLRGYTRVTAPGVSIECAAIDTSDVDWWLLNQPDFAAAITAGRIKPLDADPAVSGFVVSNVVITPPEGETDLELPRQLVAGQPSDAIDAQWQRLKATCKAQIKLTNGEVIHDQTISFLFTATDAVTGVYGSGGSFDEGDPMPVGLAQDFYNAVAHVPYEGSLSFRTAELGGLPQLGHKLNLLGSANADWETMNTLVQRVTENIQRRTTQIEFGTPPHLDVADLVALLRVTRQRDPQNPYSIRVGGSTAASGSGLSRASTIHNNSNAVGNSAVLVASGSTTPTSESDDAKKGLATLDGPNKKITLAGATADGTATIALEHLTGTNKAVQLREVRYKNADCVEKRRWVFCTAEEDVP